MIILLHNTVVRLRSWIAQAAVQGEIFSDSSQQRGCRQQLCACGSQRISPAILQFAVLCHCLLSACTLAFPVPSSQ
jgi:hypothetical protein